MGADNKVIWSEGMFLRPQHFQQHDRYLERLVRGRVSGITPFSYGVTELKINRELLLTGKFAVLQCRGILPDGTPFDILADENPPVPLEIATGVRDEIIYLTLPEQQPGAKEVAVNGHDTLSARFGVSIHPAFDSIAGSDTNAELAIGKLKLRYALQSSERAGYVSLGLARVREVRADKAIFLDDGYIPPTLSCAAVQNLAAFITELQGFHHSLGEELVRDAVQGTGGVPEIASFLLLQLVNRHAPVMRHYAGLAELHPVALYATLIEMAGEWATFMPAKQPIEFPQYRHDDLEHCFAVVMDELRKALRAPVEKAAIPIPVEDRERGFKIAKLPGGNKRLLKESSFVLAVQANVPVEILRRDFPRATKIAPVEEIQRIAVQDQVRGIPIQALPVAPRQVPFHAGAVYFELDRENDFWAKLESRAAFAFHITDNDFPGLTIRFWAIRK